MQKTDVSDCRSVAVKESSEIINKEVMRISRAVREKSIVNTVISQYLEMLYFGVEMGSGTSAAEVLGLPQHL